MIFGKHFYEPFHDKLNNADYRFVIQNSNILTDCVRFIFQVANKEEVGKDRSQKKLFAEVMESLFLEFFELNIKEQSDEFMDTDLSSDLDDD